MVIDASAALEFTREDVGVGLPDADLYAPSIIDLEFMHALRRLVRLGRLAAEVADRRVKLWADNDLTRCPHLLLIPQIWRLRHNITPYDAAYVALAESLGMPLVTADQRLARAATPYCEVVTLGD